MSENDHGMVEGADCLKSATTVSVSLRRYSTWDRGLWRSEAACSSMGTDLFFPTGERLQEAIAQIRQTKAVCGHCPVRLHCLAYAIATNQEDGIWGGLTPSERRSLR